MMPNSENGKLSSKAALAAEEIMSNLFNGKNPVKEASISSNPKLADNLKNIRVPDSLVESITGIKSAPTKTEKLPQQNKRNLQEEVNSLITKLSNTLKEAKLLIKEMTTVGMLGTGRSKGKAPCKPGKKRPRR